jgi:type IV secretion system protein VirB6
VIPNYLTIVNDLLTQLDVLLKEYVFNGYSALSDQLKYPLGLAVVLYISLMGLSITQGWVKVSMGNFTKSAFKIGLIYMFAMNWGFFSDYVVRGIEQSAGEMGTILMNATPMHMSNFNGAGINEGLQFVLIEITKMGVWVLDQSSLHNFLMPFVCAIGIWGFGYALVLIALFEIVLAKIMLAVLFALAPLFMSFTLFKVTHVFFDRWLGAIVGFALVLIFISSVLALVLSLVQFAIGDVYATHRVNMSLVGFVPMMVVGFIGIGVMLYVAHLAQSIGSGMSTASGSALLAGSVGGFLGSAAGIHKKAKQLLPPIGKVGAGAYAMVKFLKQRIRTPDKS